MKRKLCSLLLCLSMAATFLPAVALAGEEESETPAAVKINMNYKTSQDSPVILSAETPYFVMEGGEGKAAASVEDGKWAAHLNIQGTDSTLTLKNYQCEALVELSGDLTIVLEGENTISASGICTPLTIKGNTTIRSSGSDSSLTVEGTEEGIRSEGTLDIDGCLVTVKATGQRHNEETGPNGGLDPYTMGIGLSCTDLVVENGGTLDCSGYTFGINIGTGTLTLGSDSACSGGTNTVTGRVLSTVNDISNKGVVAKDIFVYGGYLTGEGNKYGLGIEGTNITVNGGKLIGTGEHGIYARKSLEANDATVEGTGIEVIRQEISYGISSEGSLIVNGGTVTGTTSGQNCIGIEANTIHVKNAGVLTGTANGECSRGVMASYIHTYGEQESKKGGSILLEGDSKITGEATGTDSYGIQWCSNVEDSGSASSNVTLTNGEVTLKSGTMTGTATGERSCGISGDNADIIGGTLTGTGEFYGIGMDNINQSGGTMIGHATEINAEYGNVGIQIVDSLTFEGGTITGKTKNPEGWGITFPESPIVRGAYTYKVSESAEPISVDSTTVIDWYGDEVDYQSYLSISFDGEVLGPATVSKVTVTPLEEGAALSVKKGDSLRFTAKVEGTNRPSQEVTWAVSGNSSANTTIYSGMLTVGEDETAETLTVTATSTLDTEKSASVTVTVTTDSGGSGTTNPGGSGSGGNRPSSGGSSGGTTTSKPTTNPDGSTTTTTENKTTGTVTETTKAPDGSQTVVETQKDGTVTTTATDKDGNKTETVAKTDGSSVTKVEQKDGTTANVTTDASGKTQAEVKVPAAVVTAAQQSGETLTLPIPAVQARTARADAPAVTVSTGSSTPVKVAIPTENANPGTVAVLVKADGTEEIIKTSVSTADGVAVSLPDGATVKIVDNSKTFADVPAGNWAADAVRFSSARELFSGTGENSFTPNAPMTRAMMVTVLARFDGADTSGGDTWYEKGVDWAVEKGISDGSAPESSVTREQLVVMLWRYAGFPAPTGTLEGFNDAESVSNYAQDAMCWAVENGIVNGFGDGQLGPQGQATRAQVAQMLKNFIEKA